MKDIFGKEIWNWDTFSTQKCSKCGLEKMNELHSHHVYPVKLGGIYDDGVIVLCQKCHVDIHRLLRNLSTKENPLSKKEHMEITKKWLLEPIIKTKYENCPTCDGKNCFSIHIIKKRSIIYNCILCGHQEESIGGALAYFDTKLEEMKHEKDSNTING